MNLVDICAEHPDDAIALVSRGKPTTYGELREAAGRFRGVLAGAGVTPGERVAVVAANNWYFVVSYLAILGVGAVAVPLNPASPAPEIAKQLGAARVSAVIVGPAAKRIVPELDRDALPSLRLVVQADPGDLVSDDAVRLDDLRAAEPAPVVDRARDDLAVLMFTSGTAGAPKAAMLSHGNLLANLEQIQANPGRQQGAGDVSLGVLPFFHIFGLNVVLGLTLATGGTVVTVERFDPEAAADTVRNHGVTVVAGAPTMWSAWLQLADLPADTFSTVETATSGAAKLAPEVRSAFLDRFGVEIAEGYGLTEASPVVTSSIGLAAPPGSIGGPLPGVRVRLIDPGGHDVLVGDVGELQVQGPNVFLGYWDDPEATALALTPDGWLRTGDLATVDEQGFLYLVDRAKDLVIVSGFNVYPAEVEEVLVEHPGVQDAAIVGVQHPYTGEAVRAYVVTRSGVSVEEDDIIRFCEERLARYKCPQKVLFVDELPSGTGGKVLRRELR